MARAPEIRIRMPDGWESFVAALRLTAEREEPPTPEALRLRLWNLAGWTSGHHGPYRFLVETDCAYDRPGAPPRVDVWIFDSEIKCAIALQDDGVTPKHADLVHAEAVLGGRRA